jgi:hypothetical protein
LFFVIADLFSFCPALRFLSSTDLFFNSALALNFKETTATVFADDNKRRRIKEVTNIKEKSAAVLAE